MRPPKGADRYTVGDIRRRAPPLHWRRLNVRGQPACVHPSVGKGFFLKRVWLRFAISVRSRQLSSVTGVSAACARTRQSANARVRLRARALQKAASMASLRRTLANYAPSPGPLGALLNYVQKLRASMRERNVSPRSRRTGWGRGAAKLDRRKNRLHSTRPTGGICPVYPYGARSPAEVFSCRIFCPLLLGFVLKPCSQQRSCRFTRVFDRHSVRCNHLA